VPTLVVAPVEITRVGELQPLHDFGKWHVPRLQEQMNVVEHQNVSVDREPVTLAILFEPL